MTTETNTAPAPEPRPDGMKMMTRYLPALVLQRYIDSDPAVARDDAANAVQALLDAIPERDFHDINSNMVDMLTALREYRQWRAKRKTDEHVPF